MKLNALFTGRQQLLFPIFAVTFGLTLTGCHKDTDQAQTPELANDPAQANLAQADYTQGSQEARSASRAARPPASRLSHEPLEQSPANAAPVTSTAYTGAQQSYAPTPAPQPQSYNADYQQAPNQLNQTYDQTAASYAPGYGNEQPVEAEQAPPPLPQYSQPSCPGENYLWTPGYWGYAPAGYFWVPGAWVMAPYVGALWTPPYWGYESDRYRWHHGYWGSHIGFYGGINYGFGYFGRGYEGGFWDKSRRTFNYNRSVNNVNVTVIHNVYNYRVVNNNVTINNTHVSYNGGRGGVEYRPSPQEVAVLHEQRMAAVPAQLENRRQAESNRAQFASAKQGRPAALVAPHPLVTSYRAPAPQAPVAPHERALPPFDATQQKISSPANASVPVQHEVAAEHMRANQAAENRASENQMRESQRRETPARALRESAEPPVNAGNRPATAYRNSPIPPAHVEARPAAPPAPAPRSMIEPRMEDRSIPQAVPEERAHPQPHVEQHPAPQTRPEQRSAPQTRAEPEQRTNGEQPHPVPQPRPEFAPQPHPAPQPRSEPAPRAHAEQHVATQPHAAPAPQSHPEQRAQPHPDHEHR